MSTGQKRGWENYQSIHSVIVRQNLKPTYKCPVCGMDLYILPLKLKTGTFDVLYEDGGIECQGKRVLYNHYHMTQARKSCRYCRPGYDVVTGLKEMSADEEDELRLELQECLDAITRTTDGEVRRRLVERALEIQDELRHAGRAR